MEPILEPHFLTCSWWHMGIWSHRRHHKAMFLECLDSRCTSHNYWKREVAWEQWMVKRVWMLDCPSRHVGEFLSVWRMGDISYFASGWKQWFQEYISWKLPKNITDQVHLFYMLRKIRNSKSDLYLGLVICFQFLAAAYSLSWCKLCSFLIKQAFKLSFW